MRLLSLFSSCMIFELSIDSTNFLRSDGSALVVSLEAVVCSLKRSSTHRFMERYCACVASIQPNRCEGFRDATRPPQYTTMWSPEPISISSLVSV